ncbi:MAG: hypothetical protein H7226_09100 [Salinibacterium sp.]|nr:hypothetical protein [Salinibacterium sp.]
MTELTRFARDAPTDACIAAVSEVFTAILGRVTTWRNELLAAVEAHSPTRNTLDALVESLVVPALSEPGAAIIGAGFVATPGYLPDAYWHLAWWLGEQNTLGLEAGATAPTRRLATVTDPTSDQFRDYTNLEWWRVPERTGSPHITGPYVDYLCTDDYTLTVTIPVYSSGVLIGMVGVDSYVKNIESLLLPPLYRMGRPASVVNSSGRVVASSDPHRPPGSILRIAGLSEQLHSWGAPTNARVPPASLPPTSLPGGEFVIPCPGTSLALVLEGSSEVLLAE